MYKNTIYLSKIDHTLSQDTFNHLLQVISKENREKCLRFRLKKDALRTLYGELILRHILHKDFSYKNEEIEILKGDKGKPYVKGSSIHYNISHAGDYVACAFSKQEIGIDVEQIKEIDFKIAKRFFSTCEYEDLLAKKTDERLDYFFTLWTLKESYIKWLGSGLSTPLNSFFFAVTDNGISFTDTNHGATPFFKQYPVDDYKLSVCCTTDDFPDKISMISLAEMTSF